MVAGQFFFDAGANFRIFETRQKFLDTAIRGPGRKGGGQRRTTGRIWIHTGGDVQAGIACRLDRCDYDFHVAPARFAADFEMEDFDGEIGFAADADGFGERFGLRGAFAAHMRGIEAAVFCGDFGQGDEFVGFRVDIWRIDQGAGDTEGAVSHGLLDERFHLGELGGSGGAVVVADNGFADLCGADVGADVDGSALFFEAAEIAVEGSPINGEFELVEEGFERRESFFVLRGDGATFAGNFGSDSLGEFAEGAIVEKKSGFGLAEHVDEARGDDLAFGVDFTLGVCVAEVADGGDAVCLDGDVGGVPWVVGAVDDVPVPNDDVVGSGGGGVGGRS